MFLLDKPNVRNYHLGIQETHNQHHQLFIVYKIKSVFILLSKTLSIAEFATLVSHPRTVHTWIFGLSLFQHYIPKIILDDS